MDIHFTLLVLGKVSSISTYVKSNLCQESFVLKYKSSCTYFLMLSNKDVVTYGEYRKHTADLLSVREAH